MNERDAQGGGSVGELVGAEGRAIIEINLSGKSPFVESLDQAIGEVFEVFLEIELPMGKETRMIIEEGKEKTLSDLPVHDHGRAMHAVGLPEVIGQVGFISSKIRFPFLRLVEPSPLEEPVKTLDGGVEVGR